jgi:hypothetical protein
MIPSKAKLVRDAQNEMSAFVVPQPIEIKKIKVAQPAMVALVELEPLVETKWLARNATQPWLVALLPLRIFFFLKTIASVAVSAGRLL